VYLAYCFRAALQKIHEFTVYSDLLSDELSKLCISEMHIYQITVS